MGKRLTAREIIDTFTPGDYTGQGTAAGDPEKSFWDERLKQAKWSPKSGERPSLFDDIKESGQKKPVSLNMDTKEILDGHHRIAVIAHLNPNQFVKYRAWKPR